jgi:hypothetical protein
MCLPGLFPLPGLQLAKMVPYWRRSQGTTLARAVLVQGLECVFLCGGLYLEGGCL